MLNSIKINRLFKKKDSDSLITSIVRIIAIVLLVSFFCMSIIISIVSSNMLNNSINSLLEENARNYANQTQGLIENTETIAEGMITYLDHYYRVKDQNNTNIYGEEAFSEVNDLQKTRIHKSLVYGTEIDEFSSETEQFIVESIRNTVINDKRVNSMGILFEPNAFISNIEDYSIYTYKGVGTDDKPKPYEPYSFYGTKEWYSWVEKLEKTFSDPYDYGSGNYIISYMRAIKNNNDFKGLVAVDIDISYIDKAVNGSHSYTTMFNTLFNHNNKIVYTKNKKNINKSINDMFKNKSECEEIQKLMKKGKGFSKNVTIFGGKKYSMFFFPIKAGNTTWWSITGVTVGQKNLAVIIMIFILVIICILVLGIVIYVTSKKMNERLKPIDDLVGIADEIVQGNFGVDIKIESNDEIGKLAKAFNKMIVQLRNIIEEIDSALSKMAEGRYSNNTYDEAKYIGEFESILESFKRMNQNTNDVLKQIINGAEQVSIGAHFMEKSAEVLSKGALEQTSAIYSLTNTIDDVTSLSEKSEDTALEVQKKVNGARNEAAMGTENIQALTTAMSRINETSRDIQKIIGVIEDIADQTNLLALNASIEAARAGESGKGFAVVAEQIGKLAGDSAESALLTRELIEKSFREIIQGNGITVKATESFQQIINEMSLFVEGVNELNEISKRQANRLREVKQEIKQISSVVATNTASAEELTASSEELSAQAVTLRQIVQHIEVEK